MRLGVIFLVFLGSAVAQYDFAAGNSAPVGASISIDNPHTSGGYSPLLPASDIFYFPPPEIPHPDPRYIG